MKMEAGLDTGPMYIKGEVPITSQTTAQSLHNEMAALGATLIVEALDLLAQGKAAPVTQPEEGVTYAAKLTREEGVVDWRKSAVEIERQVRGLTPWPGTFFSHGEEKIKILKAEIVPTGEGEAGVLLDDLFTVACGQGALRLSLIQRAGKKPAEGAAILRGLRLSAGHCFL